MPLPDPPVPSPGGPGTGELRLRPGAHVVRRDDRHLQVGTNRHDAVVVPDLPSVRVLLEQLRDVEPDRPPDQHDRTAWVRDRLAQAGLLVARAALARDRRTHDAGVADLVHARHGASASARLAARSTARVEVLAVGTDRSARVDPRADLVTGLLEHGVRVVPEGPGGPWEDREEHADGGGARVVVVVAVTAPRRSVTDPLVRAGLPHLVVAGEGAGVRLGPFVVPGHTACLRCLDAHESVADPRWPLVRDQVAGGEDHPLPSTLDWGTAVRLAAGDVLRWVDGDEPVTWSATIDLGPDPILAPRVWGRHPHCGCGWDGLDALAGLGGQEL